MEIVILVVVLVALVAAGLGFVAYTRSRRHEIEGEVPPAPGAPTAVVEAPAPPAPSPVAAPPEVAVEAPPAVEAPAEVAVEAPPEVEVVEVVARPRLRDRLGKARAAFAATFGGKGAISDGTWDDLEEALLLADVGMGTTTRLLDGVRERARVEKATDVSQVGHLLREEVEALLAESSDRSLAFAPGERNVWMFVGVNGVGKTTTIGKVAAQQGAEGRSVVLAAGDTFRAAAAEQLGLWAERTGAEIVRGQEGADPGSVVFDAMGAAAGRDADLVLVDTAGRLHTKTNLMEELRKVRRIVERSPGALKEVLLVLDATTGQNGLAQAKQFAATVDVSGIVLTKLDGTAKGGIVLAIQDELGIPVKLVGLGEGVGDLVAFDPSEFAAALFEGE